MNESHQIAYIGTNFTVMGTIHVNEYVDTNVTTVAEWSNGDISQEGMSALFVTKLTFQPLTTNSSGKHTLIVTVKPSDDSDFIVMNTASISYDLVVKREFLLYFNII